MKGRLMGNLSEETRHPIKMALEAGRNYFCWLLFLVVYLTIRRSRSGVTLIICCAASCSLIHFFFIHFYFFPSCLFPAQYKTCEYLFSLPLVIFTSFAHIQHEARFIVSFITLVLLIMLKSFLIVKELIWLQLA